MCREGVIEKGARGVGGGGCCFVNDTATTEIYTLSLHDALPILKDLVSSDGVSDVASDGSNSIATSVGNVTKGLLGISNSLG